MRVPLVDGQGNFGSVDGDGAAAMRYTEARLAKPAMELLRDLETETVDWNPNYDESLRRSLPSSCALPNLLVNGSNGIAGHGDETFRPTTWAKLSTRRA